MSYEQATADILAFDGVEESTMMKTPCLRYRGAFLAMMFDEQDALIIKVSADRVNVLIAEGVGLEFNFTKKRFKEWVLIPIEFQDDYGSYMIEALRYAQQGAKE